MCKRNELLGSCVMSCGGGLLLSLLFGSEFAMAVIGIGLVLCGLCISRRQC